MTGQGQRSSRPVRLADETDRGDERRQPGADEPEAHRAGYCHDRVLATARAHRGAQPRLQRRRGLVALLRPRRGAPHAPEWLDQSVYRGHEGLREVLHLWTESFDEYHWSQERLIDGDADMVGRPLLPARADQGRRELDRAADRVRVALSGRADRPPRRLLFLGGRDRSGRRHDLIENRTRSCTSCTWMFGGSGSGPMTS